MPVEHYGKINTVSLFVKLRAYGNYFFSVSYNANQYEFIVMLVSDFMLSNFYFASVLV